MNFRPEDYERRACPRCGAATEAEAETACRPWQDESGEYYCAVPEGDVDADGYLLAPTAAAIARLNAHYDALAAADGEAA